MKASAPAARAERRGRCAERKCRAGRAAKGDNAAKNDGAGGAGQGRHAAEAGRVEDGEADLAAVAELVARINRHDVGALIEWMTDDHLFIDSLGRAIRGRESMRGAWEAYFRWFPDYLVVVEQMAFRDGTVLACGVAAGPYGAGGASRPGEARWAVATRGCLFGAGRLASSGPRRPHCSMAGLLRQRAGAPRSRRARLNSSGEAPPGRGPSPLRAARTATGRPR